MKKIIRQKVQKPCRVWTYTWVDNVDSIELRQEIRLMWLIGHIK